MPIQALARNGYSEAAVKAALHAPNRRLSFRYDLLDKAGAFKTDITGRIRKAAVRYDEDAQIKRTARFELTDDGTINFLADRIRPWVLVRMPDAGFAEFAQGVFLLSTPPKQIQATGPAFRQVEAYDLMQILLDDAFDYRFVANAGDNVVAEVKSVLATAGIFAVNIPDNPTNLSADRDWAPGTPKAQIVADLLLMINYEPLWFDEMGWARSDPYVLPTSKPADYTYQDDAESVMLPEATQRLDTFKIPNKWKLVVTEPDLPPLQSVYTNSNPASPTSTVSRGRTIMAPIKHVLAVTQADLDGLAERTAFEASQIYEAVEFKTAIMPFHSHRTIVRFTYARLGVSAKYQEAAWEFDLSAGADMSHEVRRLVEV